MTSREYRAELVVMVDIFCACIETRVLPSVSSKCHQWARELVELSGRMPVRKRVRLPGKRESGELRRRIRKAK